MGSFSETKQCTNPKKETMTRADPLLALAREAFDESKPMKLDLLMATLASTETSDEHMIRLFQLLVSDEESTTLRRRSNQKRVLDLLVKSSWSHRSESVVAAFVNFALDTLISNLWAVKNFLQVVVKLFVVSKKEIVVVAESAADNVDVEEELRRRRSHETVFNNAQLVLEAVIRRIPGVRHHILPLLEKAFPFKKLPTYIQECFVLNLLQICDRHPDLRPPLLLLIFQRLTALDNLASRSEILEKDYGEEASVTANKGVSQVFDPQLNDSLSQSSSSTDEFYLLSSRLSLCLGTRMSHGAAQTLDSLMLIVFQWLNREWRYSRMKKGKMTSTNSSLNVSSISSSSSSSSSAPADSFQSLWRTLLSVFQQTLLTSDSTAHSQFVLFYVSSFSPALTEAFVDFLWKRVRDPNQPAVIRRAAACYIASFAARAKFLKDATLMTIFENMIAWATRYSEKIESGIDGPSFSTRSASSSITNCSQSRLNNRDSTYYLVVQSIFYIVVFRHQKLFANSQSLRSLGLRLKRLVDSPLNPLQFCLPSIADNFAVVCSSYELIDCFPILNVNRRSTIPLADSQRASEISFATFFPFEPYLLIQSGVYINANDSYFEFVGFSSSSATVAADSPPRAIASDSADESAAMDLTDSTELENSWQPQSESKVDKRKRLDSVSFDNDDDFGCLNQMILDL